MILKALIKYAKEQVNKANLPLNDVYILLEHVLKMDKVHLFSSPNLEIKQENMTVFNDLFKRYLHGEPLQYLLGHAYFYGLKFKVNPHVLIPRFDSETLVEIILNNHQGEYLNVIDLGTGSGNLAITLKKHRPTWQITALDNDEEVLKIAKENALTHQVNLNFLNEDMIRHLKTHLHNYDIIISNPPYIAENDSEVERSVKDYEPTPALFAKDNGLYFYKEILALNFKGFIYFEIGHHQAQIIIENHPNYHSEVFQDLSGKDRVLKLKIKK